MGLSELAKSIPESPTLKLNEIAKLLREKGEAVVHLGGGEPKNKAPQSAILAAAAKLNTAEIKYTPSDGTPQLKQEIIRYTEEYYGRRPAMNQVVVTSGAKQAIYNLLYALVNPQEEVVLLAPYWVSYPEMVRMVNGVPVIVTPEDGGFEPKIEEIEAATSSYTKLIIANSPNNPSGVMYSAEFIGQLVELCESRGIYLMMDDIYHRLVFDGKTAPSCYDYTKKDIEESRVIVVNGISKLYGMTGFRIGWAVGPSDICRVLSNIQAQTTSCTSGILQASAVGALSGVQSTVSALRMQIENARNVMLSELSSLPGVRVRPPDGTFYCLPDFSAYEKDSLKLCKFLLDKARVVTVPGKEFGMEGHLRLSYTGSIKDITEGVSRIRWALDPNSPNDIFIGDRKVVRDWL